MSSHVLLNFLNELQKRDKMLGKPHTHTHTVQNQILRNDENAVLNSLLLTLLFQTQIRVKINHYEELQIYKMDGLLCSNRSALSDICFYLA